MEVRIRLQKAGKISNKRYNYRVVVMSRADSRQGRNLDHLGYYDPAKKPATFHIDLEKLQKWLNNGAQMSDTVDDLVKQFRKKSK